MASTAAVPQEPAIDQRRLLVIIGVLLLGMLLAALDQTIVATALPTIAGDLHGLSDLSWIVTAYILASTASTPLWGKLGDLYGRVPHRGTHLRCRLRAYLAAQGGAAA